MLTRRDAMRLSGALLAAAELFFARRSVRAQGVDAVGKVVAADGQSFEEAQGKNIPLKPGDSVAIGKPISVPAGAKLKLQMSDGATLAVASESRMTIIEHQRQNTKITLAEGLVRATATSSGSQSGIEVASGAGTATANGADFFVEAKSNGMQVGVLVGSVAMASAASARVETIPARWGARVEAGRDPVPPRLWSPAEFAAVIARTNVG